MEIQKKEPKLKSQGRLAQEELAKRRARTSLLNFIVWCWDKPGKYRVGRHTRAFCEWFDGAVERWEKGESSYCLFNCPPRHGKSEMCQFACAYFLGRLSKFEPSLIYTGYGASLVQNFSRHTKNIISSEAYSALWPELRLADGNQSVESWSLHGSSGVATFTGLGGGLTGKGGHLIIVDDYCKNAEEAESEVYREKTWEGFASDLFTRKMSPSIVIVTATPWHMDDLTGRLRRKMKEDPKFPRWDQLMFPAESSEYQTLFPEMFDEEWYDSQRSTLGSVRWAAMFLCNPIGEGQALFDGGWLHFYESPPSSRDVYIFVDTAGNKKRRNNDYMVMWVVGCSRSNGNFYILDGVRDKMNLSERTEVYRGLVQRWRPRMTWWEQVGAQTDLEHVRIELDRRGVHTPMVPINQRVSKEGRIEGLQPLFESGRIWMPKRLMKKLADGRVVDLVQQFIDDEFTVYPSVSHDDMLDCLANLTHPDVAPMLAKYDRSMSEDNIFGEFRASNYCASRRAAIFGRR